MARFLLAAVATQARRVAGKSRVARRKAAAAWGDPRLRAVRRAALLSAAAAFAGLAWHLAAEFGDEFNPSADAKTLHLAAGDADPESTSFVLRLLREDQADGRVAVALLREGKVGRGAWPELAPALNRGRIPAGLAEVAQTLREALENGKAFVYTVWVEGVAPSRGGTVALSLDGQRLGSFPCGADRYALSLLLRTEAPARLRVQAETLTGPDLSFRAETAAGEARTRRLRPGRTDEWLLLADGP